MTIRRAVRTRPRAAAALTLLALTVAGGAAVAQDGEPTLLPAESAQVDQLSTAAGQPPRTALPQVGATEKGVIEAPAQVGRSVRSTAAPRQLAPEERSARASEPLSNPGQSRPAGTERLAGRDACDPGRDGPTPDVCDRPIETRAQQFARPDPTKLSPEQRLLVDQRLRESASVLLATRRPADWADMPDNQDAQAVASAVLDPPGVAREEPVAPESAEAIEVLVRAIQVQPGNAATPQ